MALHKGIWDPKPRLTHIKGTNLKSLIHSNCTRTTGPIGTQLGSTVGLSHILTRWTPHPVIVTIRENRGYIGVLLYPIIPLLQGGGSS